MARPIASRFVHMVPSPDPSDPQVAPQRSLWWTPCKGMNTTLPAQLLNHQQLAWAQNVGIHYGTLRTRAGIRNVGTPTSEIIDTYLADSFEGSSKLYLHTPTDTPLAYVWNEGRYGTSTNSGDGSRRDRTLNVTDGELVNDHNDGGSGSTIFGSNETSDVPPEDLTASFDITCPVGARPAAYGFGVRSTGSGQSGYWVEMDVSAPQTITLVAKNSGGSYLREESNNIPGYVAGQTYKISLRAVGTTIEVLVDDVVLISWTDSTYTVAGVVGVFIDSYSLPANPGTNVVRMANFTVETAAEDPDITTVVEFTTSTGISYLIRMGLFGVQYFDGTDWNDVPGYTPPAEMTVYDKFACTAFGDKLIFSDGLSGLFAYDPVAGSIAQITEGPSAKHLTTFAGRIIASNVKDTDGLNHKTRIQWSVKNNSDDWDGIGSGFDDLLSTPGGFIDEQTGVYPVDDYTALIVRTNSIWQMVESGNVSAPFRFDRRFPGIGSKHRHSIAPVPGGIIGLFNDLSVYFVSASGMESIGDDIRDPRWALGDLRVSRDETNYPNLLAVGAYSSRQRKYTIALSARSAPSGDTGQFTAAMYEYDIDSKTWTYKRWVEGSIHWITYSTGTSIGLTIDSSTGTIDAAGSASIDSELGNVPFSQQDVLVGASGGYVYREDRALTQDVTDAYGTDAIEQSMLSCQIVATSPIDSVVLVGFKMVYQSSVTGNLTLRIHVWDSGAEQTVDYVLPVQKSMDANDEVLAGTRVAYIPARATGYNMYFEVINNLNGRVDIIGVLPEIEGKADVNSGFTTAAMP